MVKWHYRFNGHEFEQTLGDSERQGPAAVHVVAKSWTQLNNKILLTKGQSTEKYIFK